MSIQMRQIALLVFIILLSNTSLLALVKSQEQVLNYKVLVNEEPKGNLVAKISRDTDKDFKISLVTTLDVFFLKIVSDISLEYANGKLKQAKSSKHINGVRTEYTEMNQSNGKMVVKGSEIEDLSISYPVTFSVGRLYHYEPSGFNKIFSERLGSEVSINNIGRNSYELRQPDGTRNYFFYRQGICFEMQTRMRGKKVRFVLQ
jgi:hypothetical protein